LGEGQGLSHFLRHSQEHHTKIFVSVLKHGVFRDVLLGFDDHVRKKKKILIASYTTHIVVAKTLYQSDAKGHPYFGPIVGRLVDTQLSWEQCLPDLHPFPLDTPTEFEMVHSPSQSVKMLLVPINFLFREMKVGLSVQSKSTLLNINVRLNIGNNTLHGGFDGFDRRTWQVVKVSPNSVTFSLVDLAGTQGFPGTVLTTVCQ